MQLLWFILTHGEGRYLGTAIGRRVVNFDYWRQIVAGETADFQGNYFNIQDGKL